MQINRTFDIITYQEKFHPQEKAFTEYTSKGWKSISTKESIALIQQFSIGLLQLGFKKGDIIITVPRLANTNWILLDYASMSVGILIIPFHATNQTDDLSYILGDSKGKTIIFENNTAESKFNEVIQQEENIKIHLLDGFIDLLKSKGQNSDEKSIKELELIQSSIEPDEICTVIYTSGSSGEPKGVMLSHRNICSNLLAVLPIIPIDPKFTALSFLPFSHVFERMSLYAYTAIGLKVHLVKERSYLEKALIDVKPDVFTSVPLILEKMYNYFILSTTKHGRLQRFIVNWAIRVGKNNFSRNRRMTIQRIRTKIAYILVFRKIRKRLGGKVKYIIVGAAALQPKLGALFASMGIKIREGYGMTETSPVISINRFTPGMNRFGTVGIPIPGVSVKIKNSNKKGEGEIWVKGPNVMKGYFNKPEETRKVLTKEGWFQTGDIGKFKGKFLKLTDRKKDIFKTSSGKYVAPLYLENLIKSSLYIDQAMVFGQNKPFVGALIKPDFTMLEEWCKSEKIHWTSPQYMIHNIKVKNFIDSIISQFNENLPNHYRIRKIALFFEEWTIEGGELTYTMKLKRHVIFERNLKTIQDLFKGLEV